MSARRDDASSEFSWGSVSFRSRPGRYLGVAAVIVVRYFMALFYVAAAINKFRNEWMWTDKLKSVFEDRLAELAATGAQTYGPFYLEYVAMPYLEYFAIPFYWPVAVAVSLGELAAGLGFLFGVASRWAGGLAFFLMFNFALGGYYDASLIPLILMALLIAATPSGRWLGLDRRLAARHPGSLWFK